MEFGHEEGAAASRQPSQTGDGIVPDLHRNGRAKAFVCFQGFYLGVFHPFFGCIVFSFTKEHSASVLFFQFLPIGDFPVLRFVNLLHASPVVWRVPCFSGDF